MDKTVMRTLRKKELRSDFPFWQTRPYEERLATVEFIRQEYHDGIKQGFQRVYSISYQMFITGSLLASILMLQLVSPLPIYGQQRQTATATFAGGCFWCMEPPFDELEGVISTTSGYSGGHKRNPTYEEVSAGGTGHAEVLQVTYNPAKISYARLLEVFWKNVDPTTPNRQFCDKGSQYRSAIFFHDEGQRKLAEESKRKLELSGKFKEKIVTEIVPLKEFYPAEGYHQDYYKKSPVRYKSYRLGCGRDKRLKELWGE